MKTKEEFIKERRAKMEQETQARLARLRGQNSPNQERLLSKMGIRLKVDKPLQK